MSKVATEAACYNHQTEKNFNKHTVKCVCHHKMLMVCKTPDNLVQFYTQHWQKPRQISFSLFVFFSASIYEILLLIADFHLSNALKTQSERIVIHFSIWNGMFNHL